MFYVTSCCAHASYVLIEPMNSKWLLFLSILPLVAQPPSKIDIDVDGKPFATFNSGVDANKPYLWPIRSAGGKIVTRRWPMVQNTGESNDHPHHRGLWFSYDGVNGYHFWGNDPAWESKDPKIGKIVVKTIEYDDKANRLAGEFDWTAPGGKVILHENRVMTFGGAPNLRTIDIDITLTGPEKVVFGDSKEGALAIRLADSMTEKSHGGEMVNAEGARGMKNVWGKRSNWVDYSGLIDGEKIGVAIFDAASNPRHPHLLACARLRPVRPRSVRPACLRSFAARKQLDARCRPVPAISLACCHSFRRRRIRPHRRNVRPLETRIE